MPDWSLNTRVFTGNTNTLVNWWISEVTVSTAKAIMDKEIWTFIARIKNSKNKNLSIVIWSVWIIKVVWGWYSKQEQINFVWKIERYKELEWWSILIIWNQWAVIIDEDVRILINSNELWIWEYIWVQENYWIFLWKKWIIKLNLNDFTPHYSISSKELWIESIFYASAYDWTRWQVMWEQSESVFINPNNLQVIKPKEDRSVWRLLK